MNVLLTYEAYTRGRNFTENKKLSYCCSTVVRITQTDRLLALSATATFY